MKSRSLFLTVAAGLIVSGIGALDARAASVALPTTYDALVGNSATVVGAETLTFSGFTYSSSSIPGGSAPLASAINVNPFAVAGETGIMLSGTLAAPANTVVDVSISYTVTAPAGELLNDAYLGTAGGPVGGAGTGTYTVSETLANGATLAPIGSMTAGSSVATTGLMFGPVQSIFVTKDIYIVGGSTGESLSVIQQGFSSITAVPEPTSVALLGIGMTGFLAFRRLFKRTSVA